MSATAGAIVEVDIKCDTCAGTIEEGDVIHCDACLEKACDRAAAEVICDEDHCSDHDGFDPAATIRGYADRGRIMATMKQETIEELYELAFRIEQGDPVS